MLKSGRARRVSVYLGESDQWNDEPAHLAILHHLRRQGAAGATVSRGLAGFGAHSRAHSASVLQLSLDIPLIITWVDEPERVERLLPRVREMVSGGLITIEDIEVYRHLAVHDAFPRVSVADVMTTDVVTIGPDDPVSLVAERLLEQEIGRASCRERV